ncbi:3'(2'),5'-bisphosphate nucleotidase CysQ [Pararhizobium mangrovi]|uniref:3'(2'),5'-bisphosphate nucleotidase CysQ n=2 Tax=Pararhizobium mangrovi TaxID=2590452 RepID=A0A506UFU7_9HYPH|nr:3'(2'),5'-bisphosphate nucleotidase CysQ [Pararhizobium mangrovi]
MLADFESLALVAGKAILDVRNDHFAVERKDDDSPVTEADRQAEAIILEGLRTRWSEFPCIAEEEVAGGRDTAIDTSAFILVDPLDGTREFVNGRDEFTVNIAFVRDGVPLIGVVYAPALGVLYRGGPDGAQRATVDERFAIVERQELAVDRGNETPVIVTSRLHRSAETEAFLARFRYAELAFFGSSLKFCCLADGSANLYPRFGRTMEWDTAAGDAVLRAAGGLTVVEGGTPLTYGKHIAGDVPFANPWFLAAARSCAPEDARGWRNETS